MMHPGWSQPSQWSQQIESDTSARSQKMTTRIPTNHPALCFPMVARQVKRWLESVPRWCASAPRQGSSNSNSSSRRRRAAVAMKSTEGRFALVASSRRIIPDLCHERTLPLSNLSRVELYVYVSCNTSGSVDQSNGVERSVERFVFIYYTAWNCPAQ